MGNRMWKWYNIMAVIGIILFIIWIINIRMTDWKSGILRYEGFIPQPWDVIILIFVVFMSLIYIGASIESGVKRIKNIEER